MSSVSRRTAMLGALFTLGGCSAITSLNASAKPLNTYDLRPAAGTKAGGKIPRTLLVARPQASAALATDRVMIKPDPASITYLPDARWSDELPAVVQALLIRSIAATGRVAYVGAVDSGPVPDKALLVRIDAFEVNVGSEGTYTAQIDLDLTIINDRDQRVVASRRFSQLAPVESDEPKAIVGVFQTLLNDLLPSITDWTVRRV